MSAACTPDRSKAPAQLFAARKRLWVCVASLAASLALVACGSNGADTTGRTSPSGATGLSTSQLRTLDYAAVLPTAAELRAAFPGHRVSGRPLGGAARRLNTVCGANPTPDAMTGAGQIADFAPGDVGVTSVALGFQRTHQAAAALAHASRLSTGCGVYRTRARRQTWVKQTPPALSLGLPTVTSAAVTPVDGTRRVVVVMRSGQLAASVTLLSTRRVSAAQLARVARPVAERLRELDRGAG